MTQTLTLASISALRPGSSATALSARRVAPKATMVAFSQVSSSARRKNSTSFGFDPGQPPSMNATPNASKRRAIRNLSVHDSEIPSPCVPSRSVVSRMRTDRESAGSGKLLGFICLLHIGRAFDQKQLIKR